LHDAGEAAALAVAGHVDQLAFAEDLRRLELLSDLVFGHQLGRQPELAQRFGRLLVDLLEEAGGRLVDALLTLLPEAEHQRGVAIALRGALTDHHTRPALDGGDPMDDALCVEDLRISELFADEAEICIHDTDVPGPPK